MSDSNFSRITLWPEGGLAEGLTRRAALAGLSALALGAVAGPAMAAADLSSEMILNDPEAPVSGNPKGDVTIVSFFDFNCPFCKRTVEPLDKVVRSDGKIRLVHKDWPILFPTSVYGSKLALAAKRQGKYDKAYRAMMAIDGGRVPESKMRAAVTAAGIDMARLERDARRDDAAITKLLKRNNAQAVGLGLQGTPVFLIGQFLVASALDEAGFRQVVKDAREAS
ncbi:DsbA family protein [Brucella pituitosa]|uniref:DsbA family protein n=1 Tax=Brucella intermedia GD04153 TaxID=2975438 RepID=A0AA42KPM8_9HYPH|nr:DsbA family protein [Brucella intermedia]MDH0127089.1 DsbA family protein [Brucella intermedia GD04153]RRD21521.1 DsbA family protein [Brucellaceae bacterium VT-16-1752]